MNRIHFCLLLACFAANQVLGHGNPGESWRAVADPPPVDSLQVQAHNSPLGKQLVVANHSDKVLEVTGPSGQAFLRIGPNGVMADFAAPDWYRTQNPGKRPLPPGVEENSAPDWKAVSRDTSWGWFDPRLAAVDETTAQPTWTVPAKLGNQSIALTGRLVSLSAARTLHHPRITGRGSSEGIKTKIVPDVIPALLLEYSGDKSVLIFDEQGEVMLRMNSSGVYANTKSESWRRLGRATREDNGNTWTRVSPTPRYTWPDSRLIFDEASPKSTWTIPVREGDREYAIGGDWASIKIGH